ncbi:UNVERIFIED_CONTAM: hypothetical protein K2H54_035708 [Gekko kuhli]
MNVNVITTLLSDCEKMELGSSDESVEEHKCIVKESLKTSQNVVKENDKDIVGFLLQQTELLNVSKSSHTFTAAHAYRFLRSSGLMKLPHPATLRRICSKFELDPKRELLGDILPSLTYIAGYCAHAALRLDRGGLKYPTQGVINVVSYTYVVVSKLLTTFEAAFLKPQTNQRAIACIKSLEALDESECILFDGVCDNGHSGIVYTRMITFIAVNTFLSNYWKKRKWAENVTDITEETENFAEVM